jgi:hypothetical protein
VYSLKEGTRDEDEGIVGLSRASSGTADAQTPTPSGKPRMVMKT